MNLVKVHQVAKLVLVAAIRGAAIFVSVGLVLSCGATLATSTAEEDDALSGRYRCEAFLVRSREVFLTILKRLPHVYGALAGNILRIEEVETNVYEVWIQHEERTDVLRFETRVDIECHVKILSVSERVAPGGRTFR